MINRSTEVQASGESGPAYYRQRVRELSQVIDAAGCDRELAIYRAHLCGVPPTELARLASLEPGQVGRIIAELGREPDVDEWPEGADWVRIYRRR